MWCKCALPHCHTLNTVAAASRQSNDENFATALQYCENHKFLVVIKNKFQMVISLDSHAHAPNSSLALTLTHTYE